MRSLISALRRNKLRTAIWVGLALTLLVGAFAASARATDESSFCSSCHEMTPFYAAWTEGPHAGVACIECHVDAGTAERMAHKVTALGEVVGHFFGDPTFPMGTTEVPDERCLRCHDGTIESDLPGFVHAQHAEGKACVTCHATAGHDVSAEALAEAGVLDADAQAAKDAREVAVVGGGSDNLAGHAPVGCSNCHDMAATGCTSCHEPGHEPRDASTTCTDCHSVSTNWAFTHPVRTDCATCHAAPADHSDRECATCHATPGAFAFTHPAAGASCETCHSRPAEHRPGTCESCHAPGTWAFAHPAAGASCATCHTKPAKHYAGTCSACHTPGKPFKSTVFRHPDANATCTSCHGAPSGHPGGTCVTCHRPATSWAFYHPASTSCASCHAAPGNHYGTACSSCHTPSASWGSATFRHPQVPGGEHTYRSFSCATCHPAGYASYSCLQCHDSNNPDD